MAGASVQKDAFESVTPCRCFKAAVLPNALHKGIQHGSEVVAGGDLAFDREDIPMQPAGWQPEEDDSQLDEMRLNIVEVK